MRLIDADKLIETIWKTHNETEKECFVCVDDLKEMLCGLVAMIDEQETAYDVEKVVAELKHPTNYTIMAGKHFTTVERAIDIVRKGGKE